MSKMLVLSIFTTKGDIGPPSGSCGATFFIFINEVPKCAIKYFLTTT